MDPVGDLIHMINPESRFQVSTSPTQILSLPSMAAQVDVIVPLLLKTFVDGVGRGPRGEIDPRRVPFAPYTWGTRSPDLARAMEVQLRALGVREELCTIQPGTKEQDDAADEAFGSTMDLVFKQIKTGLPKQASPGRMNCDTCRKDSSWFSAGLMKCAGCGIKCYCSRDCQKKDWKQHKKTCGKSGETSTGHLPPSTSSLEFDTFGYYHKVAHTDQDATALANSINLPLPLAGGGISKPIHSLIIAGKDTPENLRLLLGPKWANETTAWKEARIEVLLNAPHGSPSYALHGHNGYDTLLRNARPASPEEADRIRRIREIQQAVRARLGTRRSPTSADMSAILPTLGPNWSEMLPDYMLAINTMDQGVHVN